MRPYCTIGRTCWYCKRRNSEWHSIQYLSIPNVAVGKRHTFGDILYREFYAQ